MNNLIQYDQFLYESISDKQVHKAVFMIGGAGAGKTTVAKKMFGGVFKMVNSDEFTKFLLKKEGLSLIFDKSKPEDYDKKMKLRDSGKTLESSRLGFLVDGIHSIVLDGTGRNVERLKRQYDALDALGYDCYMVFVNTTLEEGQKRNAARERKVAPDVVERMWHELNANIDEYRQMFGKHFFEYNSGVDDEKVIQDISKKILNAKLDNPAGMALRMIMQREGIKYLHELNSGQVDVIKKKIDVL